MSQKGEDYKVEFLNLVKQYEFIGFQINEMMCFMFSILCKVLVEINIFECCIYSMLVVFSVEMI